MAMSQEPGTEADLRPTAGQEPPEPPPLGQRLAGLNVYLVGMMGAGKSAVGRPLAEALGYRFVDADNALEQAAGRPIPELFASEGEAGFRELETAILDGIACWHSLVVATGGGVVTRAVNWGTCARGWWCGWTPPKPCCSSACVPTPPPGPC